MIVVTGGAGFIGSQLVAGLNKAGHDDIVVVDDLKNGYKFFNLVENQIADYFDKDEFREILRQRHSLCNEIQIIFHQGACSVTTEWDGRYMMDNNFTYSKELLHFSMERTIPFIYASSGAVYGVNMHFKEAPENEKPVNVYGYSKLLFDNYVRSLKQKPESQIAGLRYFNVYGPGEQHKAGMASVIYHFNRQILAEGRLKLFEGSHGYQNGEQLRDFIYVDDVVAVNLWMMEHRDVSGIFNVGTGTAKTFNNVAEQVIKWHGQGEKNYIPFPDGLLSSYQSYTQADLSSIRNAGYDGSFTPIEQGVQSYLNQLNVKD